MWRKREVKIFSMSYGTTTVACSGLQYGCTYPPTVNSTLTTSPQVSLLLFFVTLFCIRQPYPDIINDCRSLKKFLTIIIIIIITNIYSKLCINLIITTFYLSIYRFAYGIFTPEVSGCILGRSSDRRSPKISSNLYNTLANYRS